MDIDGVSALPMFRLYPLVDQVADKVTAMFETHGSAPSNRYRDLVDLVLLVTVDGMDATLFAAALRSRARNARNPVTLPITMDSPGAGWPRGQGRLRRR